MEQHDHYRRLHDAQKMVNVYFLTCDDASGKSLYAYVAANSILHEEFMLAVAKSVIPDFSVVVEKGYGQPTDEIKERMKAYYGFDHAEATLKEHHFVIPDTAKP